GGDGVPAAPEADTDTSTSSVTTAAARRGDQRRTEREGFGTAPILPQRRAGGGSPPGAAGLPVRRSPAAPSRRLGRGSRVTRSVGWDGAARGPGREGTEAQRTPACLTAT